MRPGRIALVDVKAVLGVLLRHFQHKVVPGDLGKHRRRGNIGTEAVPLDHGLHRDSEILFPVSVDQNEVGLYGKLPKRPLHGKKRGLQNVDLVNFLLRGETDPVGNSLFLNDREQLPALFVRQLFAVRQAGDIQMGRQDHRRRVHRAGQRPAPRFVHAADRPHAA